MNHIEPSNENGETDENTRQSRFDVDVSNDGFISELTSVWSDIFIGEIETHEAQRLSPVCHVVRHQVIPGTG